VIAMSGVTDPYQPVERRLALTRGCLAVWPSSVTRSVWVTKNTWSHVIWICSVTWPGQAASLTITVTSLDADLVSRLEPRTSLPKLRLEAIRAAVRAGVPTVCWWHRHTRSDGS